MRKKYALAMFLLFLCCLIFVTDAFSGKADKINEVIVSNLSSGKFTISWVTTTQEKVQIIYGEKYPFSCKAYDVREEQYKGKTHYVTISGLKASTTYYYDIVSGGVKYDNNRAHYAVTTAMVLDPAIDSDIAYGQVFLKDGVTPAKDVIVDIKLKDKDGAGTSDESQLCSLLINDKGYWYVNLKNVRTKELDSYFDYTKNKDKLVVSIRGSQEGVVPHK